MFLFRGVVLWGSLQAFIREVVDFCRGFRGNPGVRIPPASMIFTICFLLLKGEFPRLFWATVLKRFDDFASEQHKENRDRKNAKNGAGHQPAPIGCSTRLLLSERIDCD